MTENEFIDNLQSQLSALRAENERLKEEKDVNEYLYVLAVNKWGFTAQLDMLQEECAELIQAVNKYKRNVNGGVYYLFEEIADVENLIAQMRFHFKDRAFEIDEIKKQKLKRLDKILTAPPSQNQPKQK